MGRLFGRGAFDLSGVKGFTALAALSATIIACSGVALALVISTRGDDLRIQVALFVQALHVGVSCLIALVTRTLAAELQKLLMPLWIAIDRVVFRILLPVSVTAGVCTLALALTGSRWVSAPGITAWSCLLLCGAAGVHGGLRSRRRSRSYYGSLLEAAEAAGIARIAHSLRNYVKPTQSNPFPGFREVGLVNIAQKPFYEISELPFLRALEENFSTIRVELEELLGTPDRTGFRAYPFGSVGGPSWQTFHFHDGTDRIEENTSRCPETTRIIESISGFFTRHTVFSCLGPGAVAAPHRDWGNFTLNCHLGLIVPAGCGIRVGSIVNGWHEGRCLIFDTSYEHEVWNSSSSWRYVLQVTVFRPELTDDEKRWLVEQFWPAAASR